MLSARGVRTANRDRRPCARAAGFTLLEVMLAVTIFGIVATAIYGTFSRTLRSKALAEQRIDVVRTGRTALGRLADEIATAVLIGDPSSPDRRFVSVTGGTESARLDSLYLCSLSSRGGSEARDTDQRMIDYFYPDDGRGMRRDRREGSAPRAVAPAPGIVDSAEAPTSRRRDDEIVDFFAAFGSDSLRARGIPAERLLRREAPLIRQGALDDAVATVFLDNVASLRFRFCDGTDWVDEWDSADSTHQVMPRAVAIDLGLYDEDGVVHHFATAVDLTLVRARVGGDVCPPWEQTQKKTDRGTRP